MVYVDGLCALAPLASLFVCQDGAANVAPSLTVSTRHSALPSRIAIPHMGFAQFAPRLWALGVRLVWMWFTSHAIESLSAHFRVFPRPLYPNRHTTLIASILPLTLDRLTVTFSCLCGILRVASWHTAIIARIEAVLPWDTVPTPAAASSRTLGLED